MFLFLVLSSYVIDPKQPNLHLFWILSLTSNIKRSVGPRSDPFSTPKVTSSTPSSVPSTSNNILPQSPPLIVFHMISVYFINVDSSWDGLSFLCFYSAVNQDNVMVARLGMSVVLVTKFGWYVRNRSRIILSLVCVFLFM